MCHVPGLLSRIYELILTTARSLDEEIKVRGRERLVSAPSAASGRAEISARAGELQHLCA